MAFLASELTKSLKRYDRELFADLNESGLLCVFRKIKRIQPVCVTEEFSLSTVVEGKQFVLALTDNWTIRGKRRAWGTDLILTRLREIDLQTNERFFEELEKQEERSKEKKDRHLTNELEAWASENRRAFAKATDDILTHSLSKDNPRKRRKDRSFKNANFKS